MKKLVIAGASVALAAMPVLGVFAADGNNAIVDNIEVTIDSACSVTATNATNTYAVNMSNSQLKSDIGSTTMNVKCNDNGGWKLNAAGTGPAADKTVLQASAGTDIVSGTATSGTTSNWAFKVAGDSTVAAYQNFAEVPAAGTKVAEGNGATDMTNGTEITTTYQVWISSTQQKGTYTGQVTYTLVHPNA